MLHLHDERHEKQNTPDLTLRCQHPKAPITLLLVAAMLAVALGFLLYRYLSKRSGETESIGSFAGET
ncbi:MAG: hypothetical protein ABIR53_05495 [Paraperlucidibaca sp.]